VVTAFVQATARGYAYAIENPEAAAELLLEAVPELDADLVGASAVWLADQYQADAPRWGQQRAEVWQGFTDFLIENGIIEGLLDTSAVFTNDFLPGTVDE
jgi:ABC-type nitrate/sulfonate/bicarbonate transport system substrate-binding protein